MYKPKVYLSGGLQLNWQEKVINACEGQFIFFNPREHNLDDPNLYTTWDIHFVKHCDILFAYMDEKNPSGYGLTLELGMAYAFGKTIILIDERSNFDPKFKIYFKIVHESASAVLPNLESGIDFLKRFSIKR